MLHYYPIFSLKQMAYSEILNANDKQNKEISVMKSLSNFIIHIYNYTLGPKLNCSRDYLTQHSLW